MHSSRSSWPRGVPESIRIIEKADDGRGTACEFGMRLRDSSGIQAGSGAEGKAGRGGREVGGGISADFLEPGGLDTWTPRPPRQALDADLGGTQGVGDALGGVNLWG